jgi:hypothetical protein
MTPTPEQVKARVPRAKMLGRLQEILGMAKAIYQNDRDPYTADKLIPLLEEGFDLCVKLREGIRHGDPRTGVSLACGPASPSASFVRRVTAIAQALAKRDEEIARRDEEIARLKVEVERLKEKEQALDRLAVENWQTVLATRQLAEAAEARVKELEHHMDFIGFSVHPSPLGPEYRWVMPKPELFVRHQEEVAQARAQGIRDSASTCRQDEWCSCRERVSALLPKEVDNPGGTTRCRTCAHPDKEHDAEGRCADCGGGESHTLAPKEPT